MSHVPGSPESSARIPVIHIITMLELGGAQQNTLHTVAHLDRARFQPYLLTGSGGILDFEALSLPDVPAYFVPDLIREVRPHRDLRGLRQIRSRIRRIRERHPGRPAIVHTHSSKAGILGRWAARMERVPVIVHTYHGFGFHQWQRAPVRLAFEWAERFTACITDAFIMVSRANMETARKLRITAGKRVAMIRSGIPLDAFRSRPDLRGSIRGALSIPWDASVVTMVACFKPQKAPCDFVKMAARVASQEPRAFFLMAGDGVLRAQVEAAVVRHGLESRFRVLGWRQDIPDLLNDTDVLVLTSLWEGLPRVLPQAMAAGLPVVATAVDGSPEAVADGINGFLVSPGDVDGAASRVVQLLQDPALRHRMGVEGEKRVEEFDIDLMVQQQERLYEEMILRRQTADRGPRAER